MFLNYRYLLSAPAPQIDSDLCLLRLEYTDNFNQLQIFTI